MLCITCKENISPIFLFLEGNDVTGFSMESASSPEIFVLQLIIWQMTLFSNKTAPYQLKSLILIKLSIKNSSFSLQATLAAPETVFAGDYQENK